MNSSAVPVYLNVYDLLPSNRYIYYFGLGAFHSGLEVYGTEYSFGGHPLPMSGIFEVSPRQAAAFRFRQTLLLGYTTKSVLDIQLVINEMHRDWHGNKYDTLYRNCNHFSNDLCRRILETGIPGWINRLAYCGTLVQCLLPYVGLNPPRPDQQQIEYIEQSNNTNTTEPQTEDLLLLHETTQERRDRAAAAAERRKTYPKTTASSTAVVSQV